MNSIDQSDLRAYPRRRILSGKVPGRAYAAEKAIQLNAQTYDISKRGLGLVIDTKLVPGDIIWIINDERGVKFEVKHCSRRKGVEGYYCGLISVVSEDEVEPLYSRAGIY